MAGVIPDREKKLFLESLQKLELAASPKAVGGLEMLFPVRPTWPRERMARRIGGGAVVLAMRIGDRRSWREWLVLRVIPSWDHWDVWRGRR